MRLSCKSTLLIAIALALQLGAVGQTYERSRTVNRSFAVKPNTEIQVINKYGNIHMVRWEKDSVRFEIELVVKGNKQSKIQKNFEMIDFDFTKTDYYVIARTTFEANKGAFWDELSDLANTIFSGSNRTQIDYKVYVPGSCPIKLDNKFGNVYIGDQHAPADIAISNGDLKANAFHDDLKLEIDFGKAGIRNVKSAEIIAGYAEMDIKRADKLKIDSKSSTFDLGLVGEIHVESRRDEINIEEIGVLSGNLSFSELKIEYFTEYSNMTVNYGSMDFQSVSEAFRQIRVNAKYTDIDLNFDRNAAFEISLEHDDKTDISLPPAAKGLEKKEVKDRDGFYRTEGLIGQGTKLPRVDISIESGHIFITHY